MKKAKDFEKEKESFDEGQSDLVSVISILFFFFFFFFFFNIIARNFYIEGG